MMLIAAHPRKTRGIRSGLATIAVVARGKILHKNRGAKPGHASFCGSPKNCKLVGTIRDPRRVENVLKSTAAGGSDMWKILEYISPAQSNRGRAEQGRVAIDLN